MASLGRKVLSLFRGGTKSPVETFEVIFANYIIGTENSGETDSLVGWYIVNKFGVPYAGPYKREQDAKGQLTRLRKGYTPAARKV